MAELFTLGYEGTSLEAFLKVLRTREVSVLVDVREAPISRKPGFSKNALAAACEKNGIAYEHWPVLGCPRPIRNAYKADQNWAAYTRSYKKHLPGISPAIEQLAGRALRERLCLVCFEADPTMCHRFYISEAVRDMTPAVEIVHLTSRGLTAVSC